MFEAYSFKLNKTVSAIYATDLKENFGCMNLDCSAKFKLKSPNGKKAVHFARQQSTPHIMNCPYNLDDGAYRNSDLVIKSDLEDIFNKEGAPKAKLVRVKEEKYSQSDPSSLKNIYVRTPKQLLKFCISNSLNTQYSEELTVDNIILDQRNIQKNARFEGVSGLRLLIGKTTHYQEYTDHMDIFFTIKTVTKNGKKIFLTARIATAKAHGREIYNYLHSTFGDFGGHSIAVFGDWKKVKDYNVECTIQREIHVIYKFADEAQHSG